MARIEKRIKAQGEVSWRVLIRLKGHPVVTATFKKSNDANDWAKITEAKILEGRYFQSVEARKHTLSELIERFKTDELCLSRKDSKKVIMHLNWWQSHLGVYFLFDLTPVRISEFKAILQKAKTPRGEQRSTQTVNRYLSSLSVCFTYGVQELGWLEENPMRKVRKLVEPRGRTRYLSDEEYSRLLKVAEEDVCKLILPFIQLALSTGMRSSEITTLQWRHVDLKRKCITLEKTKNGEPRTIPLAKPALEVIRNASKSMRFGKEYVFPQPSNPSKPFNPRKAWTRVVKKAMLNDFRIHDLRHSAASYLAMSGATLLDIAEILGHKTLQMVLRYVHLTENHKADVLERMNAYRFPKQYTSEADVTR